MNCINTSLVSVVIPAHNRAHVLVRSVQSVQSQTLQDLEIIIVDDGSTDNTSQTAVALAQQDRRIRFLRHNVNYGAQAARNTGIRAAHGEWIAFLDSDDEWLPGSLTTRLSLAEKLGVKVVHSDCYVLREVGNRLLFGVPLMAGNVYREILAHPGPVFPALLVARRALERIGYLDERIVAWQEWDTAIRLARYYEFGFVPEPTFVYDCRGQDTISKNLLRDAQGYEQIVRKHTPAILMNIGPLALARHYQTAASRYQSAGDQRGRLRCHLFEFIWLTLRPKVALRRVRRLFTIPNSPQGSS